MKTKILLISLLIHFTFNAVWAQTYDASDVAALKAIDAANDASNQLNWDTELNPANWTGVTWEEDGVEPHYVKQINVSVKLLTGTLSVSNFSKLSDLNCSSNQLTGISISNMSSFHDLDCSSNQLPSINLSSLPYLNYITCNNNNLTYLNLTSFTYLQGLNCSNNQLTTLDLSHNTYVFSILRCNANQLTTLDVSLNTNLTLLECGYNKLTALNVSMLTQLSDLRCNNNLLTSLDLTGLTQLSLVYNDGNRLPFSSLVKSLGLSSYSHYQQDTIFMPNQFVTSDVTLDYSSEVLNNTTTFKFYKNETLVATNATGKYTTTGPGVYLCKMTNSNIRLALVTLTTAKTIFPGNLSVSANNLTIGPAANSTSAFTINSNTDWSITNLPFWLTPSAYSGSGTLAITLSASVNTNSTSRTAIITISGSGASPQNITVTQEPVVINTSKASLTFSGDPNSKDSMEITANCNWNFYSAPYWIQASPSSGSVNTKIIFTAQQGSSSSRSGKIYIQVSGNIVKSIDISQAAFVPTLLVSPETLNIDAAANSKAILHITSNDNWFINAASAWFSLSKTNGSGNGDVTVTAPVNTSATARSKSVTIGTSWGLTKTVTVTQAAPTLTVSANTLNIGATANTTSFTINSNTDWSITLPAWLTANANSGAGAATITLTATANTNANDRTATVTISAQGVTSQTITVTQAHTIPTLSVTPASLEVDAAESTNNINVTSNTDWNVSSNQGWLTLNTTSGLGTSIVTLSAAPNTSIVSRTAQVTFSGTGFTAQSITVTQAAGPATLSVSATEVTVVAATALHSFNVISNTSWTITSSQPWLKLNSTTGSNNATITFIPETNPNNSERTGTITVSATGVTTPQTIIVTQAAPNLSVSVNALTISATAKTDSFTINSNTEWSITLPAWLTSNVKSGSDSLTIILTATANTDANERTATVTISALGVTSQTVVVTQAHTIPTLSVTPDTLDFDFAGSTANISVTSNIDWNVSSNQDWLTLNTSSGTGSSTITLTAATNTLAENRTAIVTFTGTGVTLQTITVTQAEGVATLTVSASLLHFSATANTTAAAFDITSNTSWTITSSQPWITLNPASGSNNATITLISETNPYSTERIASITVSVIGVSQVIAVTQNANSTTAVNKVQQNDNLVYPNPVKDRVYIRLSPEDLPSTIAVYNMESRNLMLMQTTTSLTTLDMGNYLPGIYVIRIITPTQLIEKKIMKLE